MSKHGYNGLTFNAFSVRVHPHLGKKDWDSDCGEDHRHCIETKYLEIQIEMTAIPSVLVTANKWLNLCLTLQIPREKVLLYKYLPLRYCKFQI